MSTKINEAAAALASAGWKILPLRSGSKLPALKGWPELASADASTVAAWWTASPSAGIGIATGHHGVFVLDVDTANGKQGAESLAALISENGPLLDTLTARTASGGLHMYFTAPHPIRNSASKVGTDLDIRASGGYVVAPPTVIGESSYTWQSMAPIAAAPAWLVRLATAATPTSAACDEPAPVVDLTPELVADLRSALAVLDADSRDVWIKAAGALRALDDVGRELWLEWSEKSSKHQLGDEDIFYTVGSDSTGPAAIFAAAQRNGWINPRAAAVVDLAAARFGGDLPEGARASLDTLRRVDLSDLMTASVPPPRFVVTPLIPAGHLTLFGSHGGAGKSILALAICAHVAAGVPWAGFAVERTPVLYVSLEDAGDVVRYRLRKVILNYGLDAAAVAAYLSIVDGSAGLTALMVERASFGVRQLEPTATLIELRQIVGKAGLLIIDNASDAYGGQENDRQQVRAFIRSLAALGRANNAGVLLLAHLDKNAAKFGAAGNSYSGSTAWHNSARSRLALVNSRDGIELVQEKLNLARAASPVRLCWSPDGVLMPDGSVALDDSEDDAGAVLAAIVAAIAKGQSVSTARSGSSTTQRILEAFSALPQKLCGPRGRDDFYFAITELQRTGRILIEDYQNASRNSRQRFVPASVALVALVASVPLINATNESTRGTALVSSVPPTRGVGIKATQGIDALEPNP